MGCNSSKSPAGAAAKTLLSTGSSHKGGKSDGSGRHAEDKPVTKVISEAQIVQYTPTEEEEEEEKPRASRSKQRKVTPWCTAGSGALSLDDEEEDEEEAPAQEPVKAPEEDATGSEPLQRKVKRKATPWTKAPDVEDEDDEVSEQGGAAPAMAPIEARVVKQHNGFCLFASCCYGGDPQPEVVFMQERQQA